MSLLLILSLLFLTVALSLQFARHQRWVAITTGSLSLVFILLTLLWVISDRFTGEGFNSAVIYHLRYGLDGGGADDYSDAVIGGAVLVALSILASGWLTWRLLKKPSVSGSPRAYALLATLFILCVLHPSSNAFLADYNRALYGTDSLTSRLFSGSRQAAGEAANSDHSFDDYYVIPPLAPRPAGAKNLVVIYAESLERTYFDETLFPGLITELRELENEAISFTNLAQLHGTGFTIAGLVASQCGVPLITSGHPNSMRGMAEFLPGATCIGDVLKSSGYDMHYMGGARLSFAGKGKFFTTHGFDSVQGLEELRDRLDDPDYTHTWGLYDDTLLALFFERFASLSQSEQPFGLFGLTMDTHHPHGHQSRACKERIYGDGSNTMLNAVHCTDKLVADLIRQIRSSPWADDTVLIVASDHLALPNDATEQLRQGKRRNLLWIFPGDTETGRRVDTWGTTVDTPAMILSQLGLIDSAFGLGRDLLQDTLSLVASVPRVEWQLREWRTELAEFWQLPSSVDEFRVNPDTMELLVDGKAYEAPALITFDEDRVKDIRFQFDSDVALSSYVSEADENNMLLWIDACREVRALNLRLPRSGMCLFAGRVGAALSRAEQLGEAVVLSAKELRALARQAPSADIRARQARNLASLERFGEAGVRLHEPDLNALDLGVQAGITALEIQSSGGPGSRSYVRVNEHRLALQRGLNLVAANDQGIELIARYDGCAGDLPAEAHMLGAMRESRRPNSMLLLVAHDSVTCGGELAPLFAESRLELWRDIALRKPYAAIFAESLADKPALETLGDPLSSLMIRPKG